MTNKDLAKGLIRQAESRLKTAGVALGDENYPYAVRSSQECVELSLKAALISVGIDPPKWHDVGRVLEANARLFPMLSAGELSEFSSVSEKLRGDRERSMYGDESAGIGPEALFDQDDAEAAVRWAEAVFRRCRQIL